MLSTKLVTLSVLDLAGHPSFGRELGQRKAELGGPEEGACGASHTLA